METLEEGKGTLCEITHEVYLVILQKAKIYSCLLSDLAYEWPRGCRWPWIDTALSASIM